MTDQLQDALARSAGRVTPSPAPVTEILRSGRARRTRRRWALTGVAACALTGTLAGLLASVLTLTADPRDPSGPPKAQFAAAPSSPVAGQLSTIVGSGELDGAAWSVTLTYYPTVPTDYLPGTGNAGQLVCLRTSFNGRTNSPYGDCAGVKGPTDTAPSGMYGEKTFPNGAGIFIAQPVAGVAGATMTFSNAAPTTATTATIPGTAFTAYAIPVPAASHMHGLDEYDTQHHTVGHQNF
ncbi:hypothetical protein [Kitasatospora mediocidica]|uniref:hypothetical protein n=1 Tax=Kitasatospora mediocidica TaxID=58352 RepID=UPI00056061D8|nr:hypothetical protein [Kitasatospora mediocidica]